MRFVLKLVEPLLTLFSLLTWSRVLLAKAPAPFVAQTCWNSPFALGAVVRARTTSAPKPLPSSVTLAVKYSQLVQ